MDGIRLLRSQQADFIQRLKYGHLLHCETEAQHSELTVISGERLKQLRDFCWLMAEKYKRRSSVRDLFINNLKGKLGEEVIKARLGNLVTEVNYEKRFGGDGKVDFTLTSNPQVGIQVKARHSTIDTARWAISLEEVEKNAVLVCILIQEEVNEAQTEYNLIVAGFLPMQLIKESGKASFRINELLYGSGLKFYIENIDSLESDGIFLPLPKLQREDGQTFEPTQNKPISIDAESRAYAYLSLGIDRYQQGNYERAFEDFQEAIRLNPKIADVYDTRASSRKRLGDYQGAIKDYNQALQLIPGNTAQLYNNRGVARHDLGDKQGAIEDYTQALRLNPNYATAYNNRGVARYDLGNKQGAIEDYTQALKLNPSYISAYSNRASVYCQMGDKQKALEDFCQLANLYQQQGKQADYQKVLDKIRKLQE